MAQVHSGPLPLVAAVFANSLARREASHALTAALTEVQRLKDQLAAENVQLRREVSSMKWPRVLTTESGAARQVMAQIEQVAPTTATVLMLGETGSGKGKCSPPPSAQSQAEQDHGARQLRGHPDSPHRERAVRPGAGRLYQRALTPAGPLRGGRRSTIFPDEGEELPLEVR
jgi:transcriptional regulator of acetoin/glycerol metabolism